MSDMMSAPPQAQQAAGSGNYPSQGDPAMDELNDAAESIQRFIQKEPDPAKKADGAKLLAACHAIIGSHEKAHDSAIGLSPALKMVQRQVAMRAGASPQGAPAPQGGPGGY